MLVSICVSVFNREDTIRQCLDSILNQTYKEIEVLILDDCSTDNSWSILQEYYLKDSRIRLLKNDHNLGPARSAETLYNLSKGVFIGTVDSDDYIDLECIELCVKHIGAAGLIYTYCKHFGDNEALNTRAQYTYTKEALLNFFMVFHFRLFRKQYWDKIKYFETKRYCYDYELALRLSELCEFKLLPKILYYWRIHNNQLTQTKELSSRREEYYFIQERAKLRRNII